MLLNKVNSAQQQAHAASFFRSALDLPGRDSGFIYIFFFLHSHIELSATELAWTSALRINLVNQIPPWGFHLNIASCTLALNAHHITKKFISQWSKLEQKKCLACRFDF